MILLASETHRSTYVHYNRKWILINPIHTDLLVKSIHTTVLYIHVYVYVCVQYIQTIIHYPCPEPVCVAYCTYVRTVLRFYSQHVCSPHWTRNCYKIIPVSCAYFDAMFSAHGLCSIHMHMYVHTYVHRYFSTVFYSEVRKYSACTYGVHVCFCTGGA